MIAVPFILFALAAAMTIIGLRGRTVGDEPRCRRCDFDLRGRDASISNPRCPECGAELSDAATSVRIGVHHRRPILLSMGIVMLILLGLASTFDAWARLRGLKLTAFKSSPRLIDELHARDDGMRRSEAAAELSRRIAAGRVPQATVDAMVDQLLSRQGDRAHIWYPEEADVIQAAAAANRIDQQRFARFVRQGIAATLQTDERVRRGDGLLVALHLDVDRCGGAGRFDAAPRAGPLMMDGVVVSGFGVVSSPMRAQIFPFRMTRFPLGKHQLSTTLTLRVSVGASVMNLDLPLSTSVELIPNDASRPIGAGARGNANGSAQP